MSEMLAEEVTENNVLQLALDGHLALSWFMRFNPSHPVKRVDFRDKFPKLDIETLTLLNKFAGFEQISEKLSYLEGPYRLDPILVPQVKDWLFALLTNTEMQLGPTEWFVVIDDSNNYWQIMEYSPRYEYVVKGEKKVLEPYYYPSAGFPELTELVIRNADIEAFESKLDLLGERITNEDTKTHPLEQFRSMDNLRFQEVKFRIDPERYVLRISARGKEASASFNAIGLCRKNEVTLNRQGEIFMAMANGTFNSDQHGITNAISRLSKSLREVFGTVDAPFSIDRPRFKLSIPKVKEAEKRAKRRTVSYDDKIKVSEPTDAQAFLQTNDPEYNSDDALYSDD
ncbi:hypothetical protein N9H39_07190 [Gammaproteobacteria bacterium]|nr:hypothetical protein [Gammaproteobacteria bacterium]